jgi:hypothetical protein
VTVDLLEATFAGTATSVDDDLHVLVDGFDGGQHHFGGGPVRWQPRVDDQGDPVYPTAGDPAVVAEMPSGDVWVLAWAPA